MFRNFKIPLCNNITIYKNDDLESKIADFTFPAIIKSQIAIGSRKKAGLIKISDTKKKAIDLCSEFFNKTVSGYGVEAILIEELVEIQHEYYISITLDSSSKKFFLIASAEGGINIEEVAISNPEAIFKQEISLSNGLDPNDAIEIARKLGFEGNLLDQMVDLFLKLWKITIDREAQLVEINPLVLTRSGLIAVDGKMILDDNAAYRQPLTQKLIEKKSTEFEKKAKKFGFSFIGLDGNIGIIANGAGLTIALLDILSQNGLKPANFLDLGGGATKDRVCEALKLIFQLKPKSVLINIFGGITRCDIVAEAIVETLQDFKEAPPMVIRLAGTKETEGIAKLEKAGIIGHQNMMDAINELKKIMI